MASSGCHVIADEKVFQELVYCLWLVVGDFRPHVLLLGDTSLLHGSRSVLSALALRPRTFCFMFNICLVSTCVTSASFSTESRFLIRLKAWYESEGRSLAPQSISREVSGGRENRKFVSQIKDEGLGRGNKPDYIAVRGTITFIKQVCSHVC
jgi:hypothetical protein